MALNLPQRGAGEDRTPIIKYDARAGRLFRVDRTQADGSWESNTVEITPVFQAVMDLEHIELGWLYFPTNGAPEIDVAPYGKPIPPKPSDKHRPGFRVHMKLGKQAGGDIREMAANAQVSIQGMDALHDAYLKDAPAHAGQLPVVRLEKTAAVVTTGKGADGKPVSSQNYQPVWAIVGWAARPADLLAPGQAPPPQSNGAAAQEQAAQQGKPVAVASIEDDF
jgi:hypothetical protein